MRRLWIALVALIALAGTGPRASAQPAGGEARVLVHVAGPQQKRVLRVFRRVLGNQGHELLRARAGIDGLVGEARAREAALILDVEVRPGRPATLLVTVLGAEGEQLGTARLRDRNPRRLARRLRGRLWKEIGAIVEEALRARAAADPEPVADAAPAGADEAEASSVADGDAGTDADAGLTAAASRRSAGSSPLALSVSGAIVSRSFDYRDDLFDELARYRVAARPAIAVDAVWYPGAQLGAGPRGLGVAARFVYVTPFTTETAGGEQYTTQASDFRLGLRWREAMSWGELIGVADYAGRSFSFEQGDALRPAEVPGVSYRTARLGAEVQAPVAGAWTGGATLAYRHVLSSGEISSEAYFPRASARGVDAGIWLSRPLKERFEIRAGAGLERYGYALDPDPGDPRIAGGAVDQYLSASLSLAYRN